MDEKIQKILASRGVASRRRCEEFILAGRVTCNGVVCSLGDRANAQTDVILLDGKPLPSVQKMVYIMLNKPRGFVTTLSDEKVATFLFRKVIFFARKFITFIATVG